MTSEKDELAWTEISRETVHRNRVFGVERRRMKRPPPTEAQSDTDFFVIQSASWVNIVALTDADELVLIEQWRHGVQRSTLEIPGGMIDAGEPPAIAARRELREETGFEAREWYDLGHTEPNPAIIDNRCHMFLALGAVRVGEPEMDENEDCRLVVHKYDGIDALIASGKITHALVVVALHYERMRRDGSLRPARIA